jgi:hypothetical protein
MNGDFAQATLKTDVHLFSNVVTVAERMRSE